MKPQKRLEKLTAEIEHFHRQRIIPPLEAALRELSVDELRELVRKLENPKND